MKTLDFDRSWQLFLRTIFRGNKSESEFPKHLERKGREVLTKCDGLPLAIKDVGRQLAEKRQLGSDWEEGLESVDFHAVLELLESFYHGLDPEVRSCFLHVAFFKEHTTIRTNKLMWIWALGEVVSPKDQYETRSYLCKLIGESIVQIENVTKREWLDDSSFPIKSCRINAILHKLSIKKAEKEIGFEILRNNGDSRPSQSPRHRIIKCSRDKFNYSTNQDKRLISLFFHGGGYFDASPSYWKSFELLKILDWEDFGLKILPESIGTLMELRYLGLRNNYIQEFPRSLRLLKNLEVFDIAQNFMVDVPDIIWEMDNLRELFMSDVICRRPLKLEVLRNLETLTYISMDDWTFELSGLQMMTSLRKLGVEEVDGNSDISNLFGSLAELQYFNHLILRGSGFRSMPCLDEIYNLRNLHTLKLDGLLARLPSNFPERIFYLKLVNSRLDEDPMPLLEKLSWLRHLKLRNAYTGEQMEILHDGGFRDLKVLRIEDMWNLRNLKVEQGVMRSLNELEINNCPHLESSAEVIGLTANLKKLKMATTKDIATKIRNSGIISEIQVVDINP